jgi:hypothetical protein
MNENLPCPKCGSCGREFYILYPALWAYKKGQRVFCSWKCLRAFEKGIRSETSNMNLGEKRRKAVDIALEGGDPVEYFRQQGQKNPTAAWSSVKQQLQEKEPETYARLPKVDRRKKEQKEPKTAAEAMANMKQAADNFFDSVLKDAETPEAAKAPTAMIEARQEWKPVQEPKITKPVGYDGFTVREVEGDFARYRRSDVSEKTYIDVEIADGCDTISYTVEQWRNIRKEFQRAAVILGVEI